MTGQTSGRRRRRTLTTHRRARTSCRLQTRGGEEPSADWAAPPCSAAPRRGPPPGRTARAPQRQRAVRRTSRCQPHAHRRERRSRWRWRCGRLRLQRPQPPPQGVPLRGSSSARPPALLPGTRSASGTSSLTTSGTLAGSAPATPDTTRGPSSSPRRGSGTGRCPRGRSSGGSSRPPTLTLCSSSRWASSTRCLRWTHTSAPRCSGSAT
mmetsp:Transcript_2325/g.5497  ORF Transcript_2325/g.5497 Transcript_2325/m.5497 type:complete len:209 (-) Transcript_2325:266-892(-)